MKILLCCLAIAYAAPCPAQFYFYNDDYYDAAVVCEIGPLAGGINCLTDLGGRRGMKDKFGGDIRWRDTRLTAGLHTAIIIKGMLGVKIEGQWGRVQASDSSLGNDAIAWHGRYMRNLSFQSAIREVSLTIEFHPLAVPGMLNNGPPWLSPYLFAGCGLYRFQPTAYLAGAATSLQPLHTEGQGLRDYPHRKTYALTQWNLPMGVGIRYEISAVAALRVEGNYRKLFTDYLDDVSTGYINPAAFYHELSRSLAPVAAALADRSRKTDPFFSTAAGSMRGNDKNNDAYFSFTLKFAVVLGRKKR